MKRKSVKKRQSTSVTSGPFLIVGIGASAGGLEAFETFFKKMSPDSGMAFVLVQHMDPSHPSLLPELLAKHVQLEVHEARDGMKVQPNHVYVIPSNKNMGILNHVLQLFDPVEPRSQRKPIDFFFKSLAEDCHETAVGILLSGYGSEGVTGLKNIKSAGGLTLVQAPESARVDILPRNAIAANCADFILSPDEMPAQLIGHLKTGFRKPSLELTNAKNPGNTLSKVLTLLRSKTGNDFSQYKTSTILRRIEKRMFANQINRMEDYIEFLQTNPNEARSLLSEFLIGVTQFFRDPKVFSTLKTKGLVPLLKNRTEGMSLRAWVIGCGTGEEAYSLAMLIQEVLDQHKIKTDFTIFATDLDEKAINQARRGLYPENILSDVSPERLKRFFNKTDHHFKVKQEIRQRVIFAVQNVIKDPPFSNLDLISCRNVLIYLNKDLQKKLFPLFHYALNPGGLLFLGRAESVGESMDLFNALDLKDKIFSRKNTKPVRESLFNFHLPLPIKETSGLAVPRVLSDFKNINFAELTEKILLEKYAPASVMINKTDTAVYFFGPTENYLEHAKGRASLNILEMVSPGIRIELQNVISRARRTRKTAVSTAVKFKKKGEARIVHLKAIPILEPSINFGFMMMIVFEEVEKRKEVLRHGKPVAVKNKSRVSELENELLSTKEHLRSVIVELETSNEELLSSNEELQSTNEELQSTNEELETSKEELQSTSEEMRTMNAELESKLEELIETNNDMTNLLASTDIGTIFLDNDLQIKRFTPSVTRVIPLIQTDIGRPIFQLTTHLTYDRLQRDIQEVLQTLTSRKKEVQAQDGSWYHMRIMPYRTAENAIKGIVLTFVDVTEQKANEEKLKGLNDHLSLILEGLPAVPYTCSCEDHTITFVGQSVQQVMGFVPETFTTSKTFWIERVHPDDKTKVSDHFQMEAKNKNTVIDDYAYRWRNAKDSYISLRNISRRIKLPLTGTSHLVGVWIRMK